MVERGKEEYYFVKNDVLYRYDSRNELLIAPENMQAEIIKEICNKSHFAVAKTEEIVKRDFYILRLKVETS